MAGERRLLFGGVAEAYERFRPGYPEALIDDVLAYAGVGAGDEALEVGAGTGKATRLLLARGVRVTCLEPDAEMAAVLRRTSPGATVEVTGFEGYLRDADFPLLCAAQSWHWVSPEAQRDGPARVLRPGGAIALWWNESELPAGLKEQVDAVYGRREPQIRDEMEARRDEEGPSTGDDLAADGFCDVEERSYGPSGELDADAFVALVATTSSHLQLPDERRAALLDEVHAAISAHGPVPQTSSTLLWLARTPG